LAPARAEDVLKRDVHFHIPASALGSALIEFSTQSGIRVAASDAKVSTLNSEGLDGTYSIDAALHALLRGTGLEFSLVGTQTIAIRGESFGPKIDGLAQSDPGGSASRIAANTTVEMPDVNVIASHPPTDQELAGDSTAEFVLHHATTHFVNISTTRNLARWRGGRQSICPLTEGLTHAYDAFVSARVRAIAENVGAPVQSDPRCKSNVQILFTDKPEEKMDAIVKWATSPAFHNRYAGGRRALIAFKSDHAIQGWYLTTGGGEIVLNTDVELVGLDVLPVWPQVTQRYLGTGTTGSRLGGGSGSGIGIGIVILVVDTTKVVGYTIGSIADYLAMLTLSIAQSPDHCDQLPSIFDLMSSTCGAREKPIAITGGDLAFLKALYYKNTGLGPSLSRAEISGNMLRQLRNSQ
jgi:hypothetical protein